MNGDNWGKRKGAPSKRVKKNMELTEGFVSPTLRKDFSAFQKRGYKNPSGLSQIDAAHRTSDHTIRTTFLAFREEIDNNHAGKRKVTSAEFTRHVDTFLDTHWDASLQTAAQHDKVRTARAALVDAHTGGRRLTYAEAAKIGNSIKTIANESIKNIGPGESSENRRGGAKPDQRYMASPGGKHAVNTPITRQQRRFHEQLEHDLQLPHTPSRDYRTNRFSSSMPTLSLPIYQSPKPGAKPAAKTLAPPLAKPATKAKK